jgi:anti-sigma-K factor RskA
MNRKIVAVLAIVAALALAAALGFRDGQEHRTEAGGTR